MQSILSVIQGYHLDISKWKRVVYTCDTYEKPWNVRFTLLYTQSTFFFFLAL